MSKITVNITRASIYHIAEGISVTISQHNGGTPTYEQLWASPDEARKLDIYYREAISDLERQLTEWIRSTSSQFSLTQDGTDYALTLSMSPHWPVRLTGLLTNKLQDYLVHAVTAGWLNDFAGLDIKQDYQAMAGQDLSDIREVICQREFAFKEAYRREDNVAKHGNAELPPYCRRKNLRHRDNDIVDTRSDYTDWSGTGMAFRSHKTSCGVPEHPCRPLPLAGCEIKQKSCRVSHGHGYTPSPLDCRPHHHPAMPPKGCCPDRRDPRIPDNPTHPNYPPVHTNGIDWDDTVLYDLEGSEHFMNPDNIIQHDNYEQREENTPDF